MADIVIPRSWSKNIPEPVVADCAELAKTNHPLKGLVEILRKHGLRFQKADVAVLEFEDGGTHLEPLARLDILLNFARKAVNDNKLTSFAMSRTDDIWVP